MLTTKIVKLWFPEANDTQVNQLLNYYQEVKEDKGIIEILKKTSNCVSFKKMKETIKLKAELDLAKNLHS